MTDEELRAEVERLYGDPADLIAQRLGVPQPDVDRVLDELRPDHEEGKNA